MSDTIGVHAAPVAERLRQAVEPTLTDEERSRIGRRIGTALAATALLIVGTIYAKVLPDQTAVADLLLFVGAIIAAVPLFSAALHGVGCPVCSHLRETHQDHDHDVEACSTDGSEHEHQSAGIMDQLVSIAVLAAIATGEYATAILVPLLMAIGHFLEERSLLGARAAIDGLKRLRAEHATRINDGVEHIVPIDDLAVGDVLVIRPGEIFPADGTVTEGHSAVDQSSVTGETVPEDVAPGSTVFAGTLNVSGLLHVRVTGLGHDTAMGKVLDTLRSAEQSRAPITQILERYTAYYMPFVLIVAVVSLLISQEMSRAVAVLVVACPCALVLSSSTAMVAALAMASRYGILIKNTRFLEVLSDVRTLILDKTGTVTFGHLDVTGTEPLGALTERELLEAALTCSHGSKHPVSRAVTAAAREAGIEPSAGAEVTELPGKGVEARTDDGTVQLGSAAWLEVSPADERRIEQHPGPAVWVKRGGRLLGAILMADRPRPEARQALADLRTLGIRRTILLTGDREPVAKNMAEHLGIDECRAELLPTEKLDIVQAEAESGERVLAIGDGVNDAPALARADVGVAMGAMGSDAAIQSADIALMTNDLGRLVTAVKLSRMTQRTIAVNVAVGISSALIMIILASLGVVNAIVGALVHNIGAVAVVINSARLLRAQLD